MSSKVPPLKSASTWSISQKQKLVETKPEVKERRSSIGAAYVGISSRGASPMLVSFCQAQDSALARNDAATQTDFTVVEHGRLPRRDRPLRFFKTQ